MGSRYEVENDLQDFHETGEQDREISLGTATIVGIFLVLALLCAVFFGFGYSLGRRSVHPAPVADENATTTSESTTAKPSPGLASQAASTSVKPAADPSDSSVPTTDAVAEQSSQASDPVKAVVPIAKSDQHAEAVAKSAPKPAALVPVAVAPPSVGIAIVQIAAVSHQEDADVLVTALKRRGYSVTVRHEPQDKLLHVQIGPFATKKEADAMRQRLQADGYNAIVK